MNKEEIDIIKISLQVLLLNLYKDSVSGSHATVIGNLTKVQSISGLNFDKDELMKSSMQVANNRKSALDLVWNVYGFGNRGETDAGANPIGGLVNEMRDSEALEKVADLLKRVYECEEAFDGYMLV